MTFSDFAQMMYPFINKKGRTHTTYEYVKYLISLIMENPNFEEEQYDNNPLSEYDENTLTKYYNGSRNLSRSLAKEIISHLDQSRFVDYLADLPNDVITLIGNALTENKITLTEFTNDCIIETCAKAFIAILYDCAREKKSHGKKTRQNYSYEYFSPGLPKGCNLSLEAFMQLERNRMWWEHINKQ